MNALPGISEVILKEGNTLTNVAFVKGNSCAFAVRADA